MRNLMRKALAFVVMLALPTIACAQSSPGLFNGQVPSAAQWNSYFTAKQDFPVPVFTPSTNGLVPFPGTVAGKCLTDNASWQTCGGGSGTPGGATNTIQYNNAGAFGGLGLGSTTTVLHGNAAGVATFSAVSLTADVTGILPTTNGGTGLNNSAATGMVLYTAGTPSIIATTGTGSVVRGTNPTIDLTSATGLPPSTGLSVAVPVTKGGTGCSAAAIGCVTAISGASGTPSGTTFLRGDNQWATPAGSGNVTGPGSAVSANLASFNGTSGTIIQDAGIATSAVVTLTGSQTLTNKTLTAPIMTAPVLGTPASGTLTNATGLPIAGLTGLGTGVGTALGNAVSGSGAICLASGSACGSATVSVTSASPNIVINPTPGTGTFTVGTTYAINAQTGTTYTIASTDLGKLVTFSNASAIAVTIPTATGSFAAGASFDAQNKGTGTATFTPATGTVNGAASIALPSNTGCSFVSDGINWQVTACNALVSGSGITLSANNVWTGQNSSTPLSLTIATATFTPTGATNHYTIGLTSACPCILANPSATPVAGTEGTIKITQDGTGSRTIGTWGSSYIIEGGTTAITLSTGANAIDTFAYHVFDSTHILLTFASKNAVH